MEIHGLDRLKKIAPFLANLFIFKLQYYIRHFRRISCLECKLYAKGPIRKQNVGMGVSL